LIHHKKSETEKNKKSPILWLVLLITPTAIKQTKTSKKLNSIKRKAALENLN
jgi:hypothetical protein